MAYVPVPKDLTKVKTKVMFNLTKRQLVCFGSGALIGVPLFFLLREPAGSLSLIHIFQPAPEGDSPYERFDNRGKTGDHPKESGLWRDHLPLRVHQQG